MEGDVHILNAMVAVACIAGVIAIQFYPQLTVAVSIGVAAYITAYAIVRRLGSKAAKR